MIDIMMYRVILLFSAILIPALFFGGVFDRLFHADTNGQAGVIMTEILLIDDENCLESHWYSQKLSDITFGASTIFLPERDPCDIGDSKIEVPVAQPELRL